VKPALDPHALERRIRQKVQGAVHEFWVVCHPGFERTIAREIAEILSLPHAELEVGFGGVKFRGRLEDCWKVNAMARTPSRISMRIDEFRATQFPELIRKVNEIPWELYLSPFAEGKINVSSRNSKLIHSDAIEQRVAIGIRNRLEPWQEVMSPPEPALTMPQMVLVRFENDICTISMDTSGELLFKRGYDRFVEEAPLRDTLASCILQAAGWRECSTLYDLMAGSGTFALEALLASQVETLPGKMRRFAFEEWPCFRHAAYAHLLKNLQPLPHLDGQRLVVTDLDPKALRTIQSNLKALPNSIGNAIQPSIGDFFASRPSHAHGAEALVVLNPPYGIRIAKSKSLYTRIGEKLMADYPQCRFAILCASPEDLQDLNLPVQKRQISKHGGLPIVIAIGKIPSLK